MSTRIKLHSGDSSAAPFPTPMSRAWAISFGWLPGCCEVKDGRVCRALSSRERGMGNGEREMGGTRVLHTFFPFLCVR
jgi:hypothetical protein